MATVSNLYEVTLKEVAEFYTYANSKGNTQKTMRFGLWVHQLEKVGKYESGLVESDLLCEGKSIRYQFTDGANGCHPFAPDRIHQIVMTYLSKLNFVGALPPKIKQIQMLCTLDD